MKTTPKTGFRKALVPLVARGRAAVRRRVRPGFRWPVGLFLVALGIMGFLPVLGFWMIPLGIAVAAMDIRPAWRRWKALKNGRNGASLSRETIRSDKEPGHDP